MPIRDFYSKLMSGKKEDRLFEALRKLRRLKRAGALAVSTQPGWSIWETDSGGLESSCRAAAER